MRYRTIVVLAMVSAVLLAQVPARAFELIASGFLTAPLPSHTGPRNLRGVE